MKNSMVAKIAKGMVAVGLIVVPSLLSAQVRAVGPRLRPVSIHDHSTHAHSHMSVAHH